MINIIKQDLLEVEKPARYVGGEYNRVNKNHNNVKLKVALCFPDLYEMGMSNYSFNVAYNILNQSNDIACERVFAPWSDFEEVLRKKKIDLYTLESKKSIKYFDILLFVIPDVLDYTNILNILELASIPIFSKDRDEKHPLVIASMCNITNPYPISDFFDIMLIGDKEELYKQIMDELIYNSNLNKINMLEKLHFIDGVYIPSIEKYNVRASYIKNLDNIKLNSNIIVPNVYLNIDEITFEIAKGSKIDGTFRLKNQRELIKNIEKTIKSTGIKNVKLIADDMNSVDNLELLIDKIKGIKTGLSVSVKELDFNNNNLEIYKKLKDTVKLVNINIGAGNYNLRKLLNINLTDDDIINRCVLAYKNNWSIIVLESYIGLPNETYKDIEDISSLVKEIKRHISDDRKKFNIVVNTKFFMPLPNTKYQYFSQNTMEKLELKVKFLEEKLEGSRYIHEPPFYSVIKGILLRGDSNVSKILYEVHKNGGKFDRYINDKNIKIWKTILSKFDYDKYIYYNSNLDNEFVWDNIITKNNDKITEEYRLLKTLNYIK